MSIAKRVSDTLDKMNAGDPESALFQICSAVENTAKSVYGSGGKKTYKDFIHDNLGLITRASLGNQVLNLHLGFDLNRLGLPGPPIEPIHNGLFSVEQIFYHAVRCGLYHDAKLPAGLEFHKVQSIVVEGGTLKLPASLVNGLTLAVVVSPANSAERVGDHQAFGFSGVCLPVNALWGKRDALPALLDAISAFSEFRPA